VSWNDERGQAEPYGDIAESIEGLVEYNNLLVLFHNVADSIIGAGEPTLLDEMKRYGLAESAKHSLSYHLSRNWTQQDFYNVDSLVSFLAEKELLLKSMVKRLAIRVGGVAADKSR